MFRMTPHILRNLAARKATRRYPVETRPPFDRVRGELFNDIGRCNFCGICAVKCPSRCIAVDRKAGTWTCDPFVCVYCGVCVDTCPSKSLCQSNRYRSPARQREVIALKGRPPGKKAKPEPDPVEPGLDPSVH